MGVPQTEDRARPGPIQALRAVFTGIGRIIMAADRPQAARPGRANGPAATPKWRSLDKTGNVRLLSAEDLEDDEAAGDDDAGSFRAEAEAQAEAQAEALAEAELAETELLGADLAEGNLAGAELAETQLAETQLGEAELAEAELAATELAEDPAELAEPAAAEVELAEPAAAELAEPVAAEAPAELPEPEAAAALPLASYDTLSLASIRARLRPLDADQLRVLVNYEQSHAERPEVLGMLERRIEKLETGG